MVGGWIGDHDFDDVVEAFTEAQAAVAPIYDIRDIMDDPQFQALDTITRVEDDELGEIRMQNVLCRLSATPGGIRWAGRRLGQDNEAVLGGLLDLDAAELEKLADEGVI